jgi:hypothetical protein
MTQLGFIALELLLGRRLNPSDCPDKIPSMFDEYVQGGSSPILAGKIRGWLERAMQVSRDRSCRRVMLRMRSAICRTTWTSASRNPAGACSSSPASRRPAPMPIPAIQNDRVVEERKPQPIHAVDCRNPS